MHSSNVCRISNLLMGIFSGLSQILKANAAIGSSFRSLVPYARFITGGL
jgi:hypothetical protein